MKNNDQPPPEFGTDKLSLLLEGQSKQRFIGSSDLLTDAVIVAVARAMWDHQSEDVPKWDKLHAVMDRDVKEEFLSMARVGIQTAWNQVS